MRDSTVYVYLIIPTCSLFVCTTITTLPYNLHFFIILYINIAVHYPKEMISCLINYFRTLSSIPVAHCNNFSSSSEAMCFNDSKMICMDFIEEADPLNIDYRDRVYLGQFRTIGRYACMYHILL